MKKINYYIALAKGGYEEVTGYKCEVVYGDEHYDLGIRSRTDNGHVTWRIDHLDTGMLIRSGFASRKEAVNAINYELADALETAMNDGRYEKQVLKLRDFKVSQMAG